ncbi:hypothetical protein L8T26_11015 [Lactococcus petauri]|uniref:hypothetical protein n=1 Tax=Lactococcus petauri TaxID=1940789 RepID=UPI001EE11418|nr:hypothetical protein [Lactococcus petauri]MCG3097814.1 hypothetical protein [Lactococcus petauri]
MIGIHIEMKTYFAMSNVNFDKLNWSAISVIVAAVAVTISLVSLYLQRKDIKKQSKYQRSTFELQNEINQNNILIELMSQIVGNIQEQKHVLKQLYHDQIIMKHNEFELSKNNHKKYESVYSKEYSDINELLDNISKFSNEIDNLYHYMRELNKDLTSKGNALQLHMIGRTNYEEIKEILKEVGNLLTDMRKKSEDIKNIKEEVNIPSDADFKKWWEEKEKVLTFQIKNLQKYFVIIKKTSLTKQEKLER